FLVFGVLWVGVVGWVLCFCVWWLLLVVFVFGFVVFVGGFFWFFVVFWFFFVGFTNSNFLYFRAAIFFG
ncbi:hypothetical protein, partial [Enterococcus faecalis]|uniref:hypothetical protein n=1 Tax=Enterococcus faecalis TaxID=1351 RepID=UPI003CC60B86